MDNSSRKYAILRHAIKNLYDLLSMLEAKTPEQLKEIENTVVKRNLPKKLALLRELGYKYDYINGVYFKGETKITIELVIDIDYNNMKKELEDNVE